MANTQAMCTSFKGELLTGSIHQFGSPTITSRTSLTAPTVDVFKAALFLVTATIDSTTTAYSVTGELAATGNYTAGGVVATNGVAPTTGGTTGYWTPSASFSWTNLTSSGAFDCVELYNSSQGNKAISVHTFGSQTVTAGNFTLTMPANAAGTAMVRVA